MSEVTVEPVTRNALAAPEAQSLSRKWKRWLGFRNIGAIYVWIGIIAIFSLWIPELFLRSETLVRILNEYSIAGIMALALVLPLAAGVFDLSIGAVMGLCGVMVGVLLGAGQPAWIAVSVAVAVGGGVRLLNFLIVRMGLDSFIATLASASMITAITIGISGQKILTDGISASLSGLADTSILGLRLPFIYAVVITLGLGLLLSRTVLGRRIYAVGFNKDAAALAGVSVRRVQAIALIASAALAGFAGVVLTARIEAADPGAGPFYLIPAFSAGFLGATQFGQGRFNPWGTLVAVFMLGTGSVGLLLAGAPQWSPQLFQGVVLVIAVGLTVGRRRR